MTWSSQVARLWDRLFKKTQGLTKLDEEGGEKVFRLIMAIFQDHSLLRLFLGWLQNNGYPTTSDEFDLHDIL